MRSLNYTSLSRRAGGAGSITGIVQGALHIDGRAIIQLGLLILIATPVARVAFSAVAFAIERDYPVRLDYLVRAGRPALQPAGIALTSHRKLAKCVAVPDNEKTLPTRGLMVTSLFYYAFFLISAIPFIYYLIAILQLLALFPCFLEAESDASSFTPPVSILKPVRGLDPDAYENFASFCRQDYPEYEIVFALATALIPCWV